MEFTSVLQHGPESLRVIEETLKQPSHPRHRAVALASELISHGHPGAQHFINLVCEHVKHKDVVAHAQFLGQCHINLRALFKLENMNDAMLKKLYERNGYFLFQRKVKSNKLLVLFTTMFNNFGISNIAMLEIVKQFDCNVLILKDATLANFNLGVAGFADDFPMIAENIQAAARRLDADEIYIAGHSSGGFAALQISTMLPCKGYLGTSHATDLSPDSPVELPPYLTSEIREKMDPRWLRNLRPLLEQADPDVPRVLYYGDRSSRDVARAAQLEGLPTIKLVCVPGAQHNSIHRLLGEGRLPGLFRTLLGEPLN